MDRGKRLTRRALIGSAAQAAVGLPAAAAGLRQKETGPRMSDPQLFEALDLGRPGLEAVAAAAGRGDLTGAKRALAAYYRPRQKPRWHFSPGARSEPRPERPDTARAERA